MNPKTKPMIVTCGLPYANGMAHIGHLRTYIPADTYVRAQRKQGKEVVFICGSDTHGTPIVVNAEKEKMTPKELVTVYHEHFLNIFNQMNIRFDAFGTTDDEENHNRTTEIVQTLIDNDYVYAKNIDVAYCPYCDRFLPDRYVEGICPHCEAIARGDECDQGCKKPLYPGELIDPRCTVCKNPAEYRSQEHYFFKLSEFEGFLKDYLETLRGTDKPSITLKGGWRKGLRIGALRETWIGALSFRARTVWSFTFGWTRPSATSRLRKSGRRKPGIRGKSFGKRSPISFILSAGILSIITVFFGRRC